MWYLYVFLQSNLLEIPIYHLCYRKKLRLADTARLTTLSNLITHPIVFFFLMAMGMTYIKAILIAETFAILTETVLHRHFGVKFSWRKCLVAALIANLVSWQVGPILSYTFFYR